MVISIAILKGDYFMGRYLLNCSVIYCGIDGLETDLYASDKDSNTIEELDVLFNELSGTFTLGEFNPDYPCIKYSIVIADTANNDTIILKEKYHIIKLQDFYPDFWKLSTTLKEYWS